MTGSSGIIFRKVIIFIVLLLAACLMYVSFMPAPKIELSLPVPVLRLDDFIYLEP